MLQIQLHKPNELDVQLELPEKWNELLAAQVLHIAKLFITISNPAQLKASILLYLIESNAKLQKIKLPKKWKDFIDPEQFFLEGSNLLNFLFEENKLTNLPEETLTVWGTRPYVVQGPINGFGKITCGEFEDCETNYLKFVKSTDTEKPDYSFLANIAAILYRQKNTPYYQKQKEVFNQYDWKRWQPMFLKLEPHRLYAIFIWYTGNKFLLPKLFPTMHEPDEESDQTQPDVFSFTKCIHAGAGPKNGSREQIRLMSLYEFLFDMEQEAIKAKELKQQMKDASK
jgi:hypothetical protein